jgi:hypothetical protein
MKLFFRIDTDGGISAYPAKTEAQAAVAADGGQIFATERELAEVAKTAPMQTLVDTWNSLTGVTPVKKFKDRATAAKRIWEVIDTTLAPAMAASFAPEGKAKGKGGKAAAKEPKAARTKTPTPDTTTPTLAREGSKKAQALAMLKRGTTREELQTAFGWLPHTTRGFLSILGKTHTIEVAKGEDGVRTYRLAS